MPSLRCHGSCRTLSARSYIFSTFVMAYFYFCGVSPRSPCGGRCDGSRLESVTFRGGHVSWAWLKDHDAPASWYWSSSPEFLPSDSPRVPHSRGPLLNRRWYTGPRFSDFAFIFIKQIAPNALREQPCCAALCPLKARYTCD